MLEVHQAFTGYGDVEILHGVSLRVDEGEVVAVLGANGAGKTTLLRMISGVLPCFSGEVLFLGEPINRMKAPRIVEMGLAHVPEGRQLFANLTVLENLELGAVVPRAKKHRRESLEFVFALFPRLRERSAQLAGTLSGGEQQMLALGRGLMSRPRLLALDEPSLGLAPIVVSMIFDRIRQISSEGTTVLLVEQNARKALEVCGRGYVLESGKIATEGKGGALLADHSIQEAYLGIKPH